MKRRLARWAVPLLALAVLATVSVVAVRSWTNGSADGTVRLGAPVAQKQPAVQPSLPMTVNSRYFTTTLPAAFTVKRQTELDPSNPIQLQLVASTDSKIDQQVGITIGTVPSDGLPGLSSYHLRTTDTATYGTCNPANLPSGAVAFCTISGPAALTIFWPHGVQYAELSLSTEGAATMNALTTVYAQAITDWQWML